MTNGETTHVEPDLDSWRTVLPPCTIVTAGKGQHLPVHVKHGDDVVVTITAIRAPEIEAPPRAADSHQELQQLDVWHDPQEVDGELVGRATFEIPAGLKPGYYRLELISDNRSASGLVIATPSTSDAPRGWGLTVDLPLIRSQRSWGIGDLGDLAEIGILAADRGGEFLYARSQLFARLKFEGEDAAPAGFLAPDVRARYVPAVVLRIEEIPELGYLSAPDRALIEWEAEEFHKLNSIAEPIDERQIHQAKTAALDLIGAVALSPARRAEFAAYVAREGRALADFALWAAIAERCHRTEEDWPEDAADPEAFGARRAGDELAAEIEKHKLHQWYIAQQFERAHARCRAAGMRLGLMRDWQWDESAQNLSDFAHRFRAASHGTGALLINPPTDATQAREMLAVLAVEGERTGVEVILAVQNENEWQEAAQDIGITTTAKLWREKDLHPAQLLHIATPLDIPLANYLAEEFTESLPADFTPAETEQLRRDAANTHDWLVRTVSNAGLIDDDFSQRALIEALHAWAYEQPPRLIALRLRDLVGQREWAGNGSEDLRPMTDSFGAPVVVDDLPGMPVLLSLLRKF